MDKVSHSDTEARMAMNRLREHHLFPIQQRVVKNKALQDKFTPLQLEELRQLESAALDFDKICDTLEFALIQGQSTIERQNATISQLKEEVKTLKKLQKNHGL